jgi:hypothetical protein
MMKPESIIDEAVIEVDVVTQHLLFELAATARKHGRFDAAERLDRIGALVRPESTTRLSIPFADALVRLVDMCRVSGAKEGVRQLEGVVDEMKRGQSRRITGELRLVLPASGMVGG